MIRLQGVYQVDIGNINIYTIMQVVLFIILAIAFCVILGKIGEHQNVKSTGGVINAFSEIYTYIHKIPNTYVVSQNDYEVKLQTEADIKILDWTLTYEMGRWCRIRCTVNYTDGTSDSGKPLDTSSQGAWSYFINDFLKEHHVKYK